MKFFKDQA